MLVFVTTIEQISRSYVQRVSDPPSRAKRQRRVEVQLPPAVVFESSVESDEESQPESTSSNLHDDSYSDDSDTEASDDENAISDDEMGAVINWEASSNNLHNVEDLYVAEELYADENLYVVVDQCVVVELCVAEELHHVLYEVVELGVLVMMQSPRQLWFVEGDENFNTVEYVGDNGANAETTDIQFKATV
ncbi:hypothetical protein F441_17130 [Phytophthora nicotianae CJ01A1]|uniref:Uncharacterized protein n=3 Tax=Phytophthora nicotianae TaxID=4792 RepID=V9EF18_PHYNI|nr:hypothetical protein F443_17260 [Phytophthora nicotianae P1569]ETM36737.1 hypothetical protein L914_16628 [Phytophthora nicotianae]ETP06479.1 hypothetical protein F441_17130 [Phytophthora nicotianae CJ01A1]